MRYLLAILGVLLLAGCGNKRGSDHTAYDIRFSDPPRTEQIPVPAPLPGPDYYGKLKDEIRSETSNEIRNSVQHSSDQLSGLVTTKLGQVAEKIVGVEANLRSEIRAEANVSATATAALTAKVDSNIAVTAELRADVKLIATLQATVTAQANLLNDMKLELGKLQAQLSATAAAQVGLTNSVTHMQAGGNNNALTPEAVKLVVSITGGLFALLTTIICLVVRSAYKNASLKEANRTNEAIAERRQIFTLLMQAIGGDAQSPAFKAQVKAFGPPTP